jgi:hypothetical protein
LRWCAGLARNVRHALQVDLSQQPLQKSAGLVIRAECQPTVVRTGAATAIWTCRRVWVLDGSHAAAAPLPQTFESARPCPSAATSNAEQVHRRAGSGPVPLLARFDSQGVGREAALPPRTPRGSAATGAFCSPSTQVPTLSAPLTSNAACCVAMAVNIRLACPAHSASSSGSSFAAACSARLSLLTGTARTTGPNAGALVMAVTPAGSQVHTLATRTLRVGFDGVHRSGRLPKQRSLAGTPAGSTGMATNRSPAQVEQPRYAL